jgi:heme exporter protein CcmD
MDRSFTDFLAMGGYAPYVWASYGAWCVVMLLNVVAARRALASAREEARRRLLMRDDAAGRGAP